jgi:hypothetical protein
LFRKGDVILKEEVVLSSAVAAVEDLKEGGELVSGVSVVDCVEVVVEICFIFEVTSDQSTMYWECISLLSHDHLICVLGVANMFGKGIFAGVL